MPAPEDNTSAEKLSQATSSARLKLADSPWFWIGLFALTALVGLAAIGPKYIRRQQRLDLQQAAREQAFRNRVEGKQPATDEDNQADSPASTLADDARAQVRFWTMMGVATFVVVLAWSVLAWQLTRSRRFP